MATRRARGTGGILETPDGTFRATITLTLASGEKKSYSRRLPTEEAAENYLNDLIRRNQGGAVVASQQLTGKTVREFLRLWIEVRYREAETDPHATAQTSTIAEYEAMIKQWILPTLGTLQLSKIHADNIRDWLDVLNKAVSPKTGGLLSHDRKHRIWTVLKQALNYAEAQGGLRRNPMKDVNGFKQRIHAVRERNFVEDDYQKFLTFIQEKGCQHRNGYCLPKSLLAIKLARRQGEILALRWQDCYFSDTVLNPYIKIRFHLKAERWEHGCGNGVLISDGVVEWPCGAKEGRYCSAKTGGGLKLIPGTKGGGVTNQPEVPLTPAIVSALIKHRKAQQEEIKTALAEGTIDPTLRERGFADLVFTQPKTQRPWGAHADYDNFLKTLTEAEISKHYRFHDTRHTAVTRIVEATDNLQIAQQIAGHRSMATTALYSHPNLSVKADALLAVEKADKKNALRNRKKRSETAQA